LLSCRWYLQNEDDGDKELLLVVCEAQCTRAVVEVV